MITGSGLTGFSSAGTGNAIEIEAANNMAFRYRSINEVQPMIFRSMATKWQQPLMSYSYPQNKVSTVTAHF